MAAPALTQLVHTHWRLRGVLAASAKVELQKRYAGSLLGPLWTVLYPLLFLGVYLFLWLVVLRVRFPGSTSGLDYVVFVFGGLVPFLFFTESVTAAAASIRQNIHLVKGVIIPVELIPTRAVFVALAGHAVGLSMLLVLCAVAGTLSARVALLPVVVVLQVMFLAGVCWLLAPLGVLVPDTSYVVNLATTLLMFVSPIAFKPDMVPPSLRAVVWINPITYVVDAYRAALIDSYPATAVPAFAALALVTFMLGALFCARFKHFVVDFE